MVSTATQHLHSYGFSRVIAVNLYGFCTVEHGMAFITDKEELKVGLIIFRRGDVAHRNFYCRIKLPKEDRYKTISFHTADRESARDRALDQDADIRFCVKHDVAVFNRPFRQGAIPRAYQQCDNSI